MTAGKRRIKFWQIPVALAIFCGFSGLIYEWTAVRSARRAIAVEVAKLQALGIPTSPEEMPKAGPDDKNAALIYNEAIALKKAIGVNRPPEQIAGKPDPDIQKKLASYVTQNQPVMDLVRRAAALPDCNFKRDWGQGARLLLPEYSQLKEFTKIAVLHAEREAKAGHYSEAFSWLRVGQKISVHTREPILIGYLVSVACEQIVLRELQIEIRQYHSSPEFVRLAREFCDQFPPLPSVRESFAGEVLMVRITMADIASGRMRPSDLYSLASGGSESSSENWTLTPLRIPSVRLAVEQAHLSRYRKAVENLPKNPTKFQEVLAATSNLDHLAKVDSGVVGELSSILMPVFSQSGQAQVKLEAARRITRQGLEIYAQKTATGYLPKAIDPTKPWAIDPFTQKPLMYRFMTSGFGLYSVGANLKDDKGFPQYSDPTSYPSGTDDVTFYRPPAPVKPRNRVKTAP